MKSFIIQGLNEDVGSGDVSTESLGKLAASQRSARLLVKDEGIIAGLELAAKIFRHCDPGLQMEFRKIDGEKLQNGETAFTVSGKAGSILTAERFMLNCLQRMSGIATATRRLVHLVKGTGAAILDTRKTTPNFRLLEKWAVRIGGGINHRMGLSDMIMIKDNHITVAGGINKAIALANQYRQTLGRPLKIEIEVKNLDEVRSVLECDGVDIIMLDNMEPAVMREAVKTIGSKSLTEASGGITEANVREVAECGVHYISTGAITHSAKSLDLSLKIF